jgi:hypothetical protein
VIPIGETVQSPRWRGWQLSGATGKWSRTGKGSGGYPICRPPFITTEAPRTRRVLSGETPPALKGKGRKSVHSYHLHTYRFIFALGACTHIYTVQICNSTKGLPHTADRKQKDTIRPSLGFVSSDSSITISAPPTSAEYRITASIT